MPIAGYLYLEVEAENEENAKKAFYEKTGEIIGRGENLFMHNEVDGYWEFYEETGRGNVTYLNYTSVDIEEIEG